LLVVAASTGPALAQDVSTLDQRHRYLDAQNGLSVDAAIARAIAQEPSLRAVRAGVDVERGLRQQAGLRPNPTLNVEHRGEPGGPDSLTTIGIEWPLDLFRRTGRTQTADRSIDVAEFSALDRERLLAADVRMQYGVALAAVRDVVVADDLLTTAQRQFDLIRNRVDTGATPPLERDLVDVELRRLEAARLLAVGRADAALMRLKPLLGMSPEEPLRLRDSLEALVTSTSGLDPSTPGASTRPDVREAEARVMLSEARIDQAQREGRAEVSLFGSYMRMDSRFPQQGIGQDGSLEQVRGRFNYAAAGAAITIPFLNRNQGQVAASEAERTAAVARREALELAARAEVAAARVRDLQAQAAFRIYATDVRELARRNLDVVRQTFELGRATVFDVIAEQRRFLDVEQGYTMAAREAWEARTALRRAVGETR
jgi:cobalt-zinc-cadmium efflux system outer membrane protein